MPGKDTQQYQVAIRDAGLRATSPRLAVLRLLTEAGAPRTHAEVADALAGAGFDRVTIYRNLVDLADAGLLRRTDVGDHVWRFEIMERRHDDAEHAHFVCGGCGTVACLPEGAVQVNAVSGGPKALGDQRVAVQVRGLCDDCS